MWSSVLIKSKCIGNYSLLEKMRKNEQTYKAWKKKFREINLFYDLSIYHWKRLSHGIFLENIALSIFSFFLHMISRTVAFTKIVLKGVISVMSTLWFSHCALFEKKRKKSWNQFVLPYLFCKMEVTYVHGIFLLWKLRDFTATFFRKFSVKITFY